MVTFIKRGDTNPDFEKRLRNEVGEPVDLSSADDVTFIVQDQDYNNIISDNTSGNVSYILDNEDNKTSRVKYSWQSGDTSTIGTYKGEFVVDFGTDGSRTFPSNGYYTINIVEDIND